METTLHKLVNPVQLAVFLAMAHYQLNVWLATKDFTTLQPLVHVLLLDNAQPTTLLTHSWPQLHGCVLSAAPLDLHSPTPQLEPAKDVTALVSLVLDPQRLIVLFVTHQKPSWTLSLANVSLTVQLMIPTPMEALWPPSVKSAGVIPPQSVLLVLEEVNLNVLAAILDSSWITDNAYRMPMEMEKLIQLFVHQEELFSTEDVWPLAPQDTTRPSTQNTTELFVPLVTPLVNHVVMSVLIIVLHVGESSLLQSDTSI